MNRFFTLLLIAGGLALGWFTLNTFMSFAHLHPEWVTLKGEKLITESTDPELIDNFRIQAAEHEEHIERIWAVSLKAWSFSIVYSLFLIIIGIVFIFRGKKNDDKTI